MKTCGSSYQLSSVLRFGFDIISRLLPMLWANEVFYLAWQDTFACTL